MTWVSSARCPSSPWRIRSSIAARNAAKVLPEPVGAAISVCWPALIAGHAFACAGVGEAKQSANQVATAGWKRSETFMVLGLREEPPILRRRHEYERDAF